MIWVVMLPIQTAVREGTTIVVVVVVGRNIDAIWGR